MRISTLFFLIILSWRVEAIEADSIFRLANEAVEAANYLKAIELYERLTQAGYGSAELYYNLGTAYLLADSLGQARLWYERALRLAPDDPDLQFNLSLLRRQLPDQFEEQVDPLPLQWWRNLVMKCSFTVWAVLALVCWWAAMALIGMKLLVGRPISRWLWVLLVFFGLSGTIAWQRYAFRQQSKEAIVLVPEIAVKTAPDEFGQVKLSVHAGTKVRIIDRIGGYYKVELPNAETGWVEVQAFERI